MCYSLATRIILIWTITLSVYSIIVLGKNSDCEAESHSYPNCGIIPLLPRLRYHPWMVFLYSITDAGESFCVGSLISHLQVVTAAHCVIGKTTDEVAVVLGAEKAKEKQEKSNCQAPSQIPKPPRPSPNPVKSSQNQFQRDWG